MCKHSHKCCVGFPPQYDRRPRSIHRKTTTANEIFLHITHYYSHGNHLLTFVANTAVNFVHSAVQSTADTLYYIYIGPDHLPSLFIYNEQQTLL